MISSAPPDLVERFFGRLMELRPVQATMHGIHEHDGRFPDGSLAGAEEDLALLRAFDSELAGAAGGLELDLARYWTGLARFEQEAMRLWARMPEAPDQIGRGIFLLLARDSVPLSVRLEAILARLAAVPAYLEASRERLLEPVRLWCEVAAGASRQLPELYAIAAAAGAETPLRDRLAAAASTAAQASEEFALWLEGEVAPAAADDWALGEELFDQLLQRRELPHGPDAILALGRRYLEEVRVERQSLVARCWPGRTVEEVDAIVRAQCPGTFDGALAEYRNVIASSREFVAAEGLATLPADEELRVAPTPGFMRGVIPFAAYEPPARFDPRQLGIYVVTERDGDLGEHNRSAVLNTSVHEGYPGHHLQFACANRHPSISRLLSADYAHELVEGWAHYCEQLMFEQGFSGSPEVRFVQLQDLVWRACRIIIDVELSSGRMTFEQAVDLLMTEARMARSAAVAEVRRYTYTPGYQLSYLYGKHLIVELRQRCRRASGTAFELRDFHDRLLYAGALPAATWDVLFA